MDEDSLQEAPVDRVELFVDLNCPFCFCQVERVIKHDLCDMVTWKGIEHEPMLPMMADRDHPLAASIKDELAMLREREPGFDIYDPGFRPNVRPALNFLTAVQQVAPSMFWNTLQVFFRALWLDGKDISNPLVIASLARACDVSEVMVTEAHKTLRESYTDSWLTGPFDERLPCARSPSGARLLGLNEEPRFILFVRSGLFSVEGGQSC